MMQSCYRRFIPRKASSETELIVVEEGVWRELHVIYILVILCLTQEKQLAIS